jgi:hypothetical protein
VTLTNIEAAILHILENYRGEEILERELRGLLKRRRFRRSAPAFVFTMMSLEDKGLVTCREEVCFMACLEIKKRYYSSAESADFS